MKKLLYLTIGTLLIYSCSKEDIASKSSPVAPSETEGAMTDGMTVLGNQLENPYSVDNMRRALANLAPATRSDIGEDQIQATHHYVKFHPKTIAELDLLKQDSTILLYEYPLDYDIEVYGTYYQSPEIPDSLPTYQYASVDVGKWDAVSKIPVEFTILEELFIPDEDKDDAEPVMTRSGKVLDNALIDALVDEALKITGNDEPLVAVTRAGKWRPAGWITYYDESLQHNIGVEGVKVKARRWFTTHTGFVNTSGYYSCDGTFKRPANYSFDFERYEFHVKGDGVRTDFDGPKKKGNWDYHFARNKSQAEYFGATVFRAAYHYYYKDIGGLRRPPLNSFWKTQLKLLAVNQKNDDINGNFNSARRFLGMGNAIKLYNPQNGMVDLYTTAIHELAHAAHWRMIVKEPGTNRSRDYHHAEDKMTESWATGVQWYLTRMVYSTYLGRYYSSAQPNYANVVIDLIDTTNDYNFGKSFNQGDKVSGYSISQIESALIGCNTWDKWKNKIKTYDNATKQHIDELFAAW